METQLFHIGLLDDYRKCQQVTVVPKEQHDIRDIVYPCHLFLDQATHTGFVIVDDRKRLVLAGHLTLSKKEDVTTYKFKLQEYIMSLIKEYKISHVWHEEVYLSESYHTNEVLNYIKSGIKDIHYIMQQENPELKFDLKVLGLDHTKWKKELAAPEKFKAAKGDDKKQVAKYVSEYFPLLMFEGIEDIVDALGMMIAVTLKSKGKGVQFKARINKKLPIHAKMVLIPNDIPVEEYIRTKMNKPFKEALKEYGEPYEYAYNTSYDELLNARYALSYREGLCVAKVPAYRNLSMRLLINGIAPKDIASNETLYVIATKK